MKEFEVVIVKEYLQARNIKIDFKKNEQEEISYSEGGVGYYLEFKNPDLPKDHIIIGEVEIGGHLGNVQVGFLGIIVDSEFTLECYTNDVKPLSPKDRNIGFVPYAT